MLSTPAGRPASWAISARTCASSGVSGAGFSTMVAPATIAGASFSIVVKSGTFHGTMPPTTPTGSLRTRALLPIVPARSSVNAYSLARPA